MRAALVLVLAGCATWPPSGWAMCVTPCGMRVMQRQGTWLACEDIIEMELRLRWALRESEPEACARWGRYSAFERDGRATEYVPGKLGAGWTECWNAQLFYHRGPDSESWRKPWNTALWHEMVHAAQNCEQGNTPPDDADHPKWTALDYWNLPRTMQLQE